MRRTIPTAAVAGALAVLAVALPGPPPSAPPARSSSPPAVSSRAPAAELDPAAPYDADPEHPWNRLHRALLRRDGPDGRTYGLDALDPLLWPGSTALLDGPRAEELAQELERFLAAGAGARVADPRRRALLQRDLWAVHDWLVQREDGPPAGLRARNLRLLARALLAVAPDEAALAALPPLDALAAAADGPAAAVPLPTDLFDPEGPWVALGLLPAGRPELLAPVHAAHLGGRAHLSIHLRLPAGRAATVAYLQRLTEATAVPFQLESLPQFPAGTVVAFARRAVLLDPAGEPHVTPLVESVQLRRVRVVGAPEREAWIPDSWTAIFDHAEYRLSRARLAAGRADALVAVGADEPLFETFASHGYDEIASLSPDGEGPRRPHLRSCNSCHARPGIQSFVSVLGTMSGPGTIPELPRVPGRPAIGAHPSPPLGAGNALRYKRARRDWGFLQGVWTAEGLLEAAREGEDRER